MDQETRRIEELKLFRWIERVHEFPEEEPMDRRGYLHTSWSAIDGFIRLNRTNGIAQVGVREHPDLISRLYAVLTVLYGAYTAQPMLSTMLRDAIPMLDKDLAEEELRVWSYAKTCVPSGGSFFLELFHMLEMIRDVYGAKHFRLEALPPTPHHAYALLTLHRADLLERDLSREELFGHLSTLDARLKYAAMHVRQPRGLPPDAPRGSGQTQ